MFTDEARILARRENISRYAVFMSNLLQLRIVCYEPLMAIRKHINDSCPDVMTMEFGLRDAGPWPMPRSVRQIESPILEKTPLPDEQDKTLSKIPPEPERIETEEEKAETKMAQKAAFFEIEDKIAARQKKLDKLIDADLDHFVHETPETDLGETWEDALRSTIRTYDAAAMELERHYKLIGYTKSKSKWPLDRLDVLRARKGFPTRSNQELLLEIAIQFELGPPTPQTRTTMANWVTEVDVRKSLRIHLGRYLRGKNSRLWTNYFTRGIDHTSGAEPSMFFICQHEYSQEVTKWVVGGSTPHTGKGTKVKWKWADELYKANREQGMGRDWVGRVNAANDNQRALERQLMGPMDKTDPEHILSVRREVIAKLRADRAHQVLVARTTCKGLAIDRSMVPTQCCYRCQCNFQYIVLANHMATTDESATKHLSTYNWIQQCAWDQQCAETSVACQCNQFDQEQDEVNRPSSSRMKKEEGRKTLSKKPSKLTFNFKR